MYGLGILLRLRLSGDTAEWGRDQHRPPDTNQRLFLRENV